MLPNKTDRVRIGLRTRRGLKGAVRRNRLKRQARALVFQDPLPLRGGSDIVIVLHPKPASVSAITLKRELRGLCKRLGALS